MLKALNKKNMKLKQLVCFTIICLINGVAVADELSNEIVTDLPAKSIGYRLSPDQLLYSISATGLDDTGSFLNSGNSIGAAGKPVKRSIPTLNADEKNGKAPFFIPDDLQSYMSKRPQQAFVRSFLFPGWGQRWSERPLRGAIYSTLEVCLWGGLIFSYESHHSNTNTFEAFAREHAGVRGDQGHQFYVDIGNYLNVDDYNAAKRKIRDYDSQYTSDRQYWSWDSAENMRNFEKIRIRADNDKNRMYYILGGMLLNRLVSAIDAARGLSSRQKMLKNSGVSIGINPRTMGPGLTWTGNLQF